MKTVISLCKYFAKKILMIYILQGFQMMESVVLSVWLSKCLKCVCYEMSSAKNMCVLGFVTGAFLTL